MQLLVADSLAKRAMNATVSSSSNKRRKNEYGPSWLLWLGVLVFPGIVFWRADCVAVAGPNKKRQSIAYRSAFIYWEPGQLFGTAWNNLMAYGNSIVLHWARNSIFYTLASVFLSVAISVPAGYAFATSNFPGRKLLMTLTLITMILPGSAMVLPLFLQMNLFRLVDTPWAVIIPAAFYPFGVYLSYVHFATALPKDLLAAGRVDGCNEWQLFRYIGLPLASTLVCAVGLPELSGQLE